MEKLANNVMESFNSSSGDIAYDHLKKVENLLSKVDENTKNINNLINELNKYSNESENNNLDFFIQTYNENYIKCMKQVSRNSLDIYSILNNLLDYLNFDFSLSNKSDLLNSSSDTTISDNPENIVKPPSSNVIINNNTETLPEVFKENVLFISEPRFFIYCKFNITKQI